ncbi:DUF3304 domain-containing protein [Paraburkholderia sp. Ac-20340]|nr:DUF3304 domain-containing protein [Paraburkholderia sp. Ac-20340]
MIRRASVALGVTTVVLLAGCDKLSSEPVYSGVSVEGMNYMPYNLDRFVVTDKFGNTASGGGDLMPGAGAGSLSCCYKLKGTEFTVDWTAYDPEAARQQIRKHQKITKVKKSAQVHLPATTISGEAGDVVLALHFYPDDHVEVEFRNDMQGSRIDYAEVYGWLDENYRKVAFPADFDDAQEFHLTARIAAQAWQKYRLTSVKDMQQYVYYALVVNPNFDESPQVQKVLAATKGQPDAFGDAMQNLPPDVVSEIKHFHPDQKAASHD